jgi:hypothetical protein
MSLLGFGVCHTIPDLKYALVRCSTYQSSKTVGQRSSRLSGELINADIDISSEHRYIRLPHPRTGQAQLYLPYTSSSDKTQKVLEVVKINCSQRRTWFLGDSGIDSTSDLILCTQREICRLGERSNE